ncbi:hypothetical protein ACB092_11G054800 [Castanea dentata]
MRTLRWNYQGLGTPQTIRDLRDLVQQWDPDFVFLSETKLKKSSMEKRKRNVGFINGLIVPSVGRSGGLALLLMKDITTDIQSYSDWHIDAIVTEVSDSNGGLLGFMEILKLIGEKNHGIYLRLLAESLISPGCVLVTEDLKGKWRNSGKQLIVTISRISGIVVRNTLGVICKKVCIGGVFS